MARGFIKNATAQSYLLLVGLISLIIIIAVQSMHVVTVSGCNTIITKRVENMAVKDILDYTGMNKMAETKGALITDDADITKKKGKYLLCSLNLNEKIMADTNINLTLIEVEEKAISTKLAYKTQVKQTNELLPGQKRILRKGKYGVKRDIYRVTFQDGRFSGREKIAADILTQPISQVVEEGVPFVKVSRGRTVLKGKLASGSSYAAISTAYTHTGFRTATGIRPRRGIVAVDPRVIVLGTKLHIEGYGYAVAADTGGAIKGGKIDVFFETRGEAVKWGRRLVRVTIIG